MNSLKLRDIHDFLEKKADHTFHGELTAQIIFAVQIRLSEEQAELDTREYEMHYDTGMQLQSQS